MNKPKLESLGLQAESSEHVAGVRSGVGRAGICKQREFQGDPEEAAEVIGAVEGQEVGC